MKILHVIHDHPAHPKIGGGGAVRVHEVASRLARNGHEVHIVSGWFEGCEAFSAPFKNGHVTFLGRKRAPAARAIEFAAAAFRALPRLAQDADVVIEDFSPYAPVVAWRLERPGRPVFLQIQNYIGRGFLERHGVIGWPLFAIETWVSRRYARHIYVGEFLKERFTGARERFVVPMGFSEPEGGIPESPSHDYIGFLGRMDFNQKGLDLLLEALEGTGLPVFFAGGGNEQKRLLEEIRKRPGCRFLGKLHGAEKWDFLAGARFVIMPSRFEGQPIVAIEAAAAQTPILASSISEFDFVSHGKIGRQFRPFSSSALREAIFAMWNAGEAGRAAHGAACREFAEQRSWDRIAEEFERVLEGSQNSRR